MRGLGLIGAALLVVPGVGAAEKADANVLMIGVTSVTVPDKLPARCQVNGVVRAVVYGSAYRLGQAISLHVPCMKARPVLDREPARPSTTPPPIDADALRLGRTACVRVDNAGALIWRYSSKAEPLCGQVSGYKIGRARAWPLKAKPV